MGAQQLRTGEMEIQPKSSTRRCLHPHSTRAHSPAHPSPSFPSVSDSHSIYTHSPPLPPLVSCHLLTSPTPLLTSKEHMALIRQRRHLPHLTLPLDHFAVRRLPPPAVAPSTSSSNGPQPPLPPSAPPPQAFAPQDLDPDLYLRALVVTSQPE